MSTNEKCHVEPIEKPLDREALSDAMAALLIVRGLGCPRCTIRVRNGFLTLQGVILAEVSFEQEMATVVYDPLRISPGDLTNTVVGAGNGNGHNYLAEVVKTLPTKDIWLWKVICKKFGI